MSTAACNPTHLRAPTGALNVFADAPSHGVLSFPPAQRIGMTEVMTVLAAHGWKDVTGVPVGHFCYLVLGQVGG
jgi:hypothetical protein